MRSVPPAPRPPGRLGRVLGSFLPGGVRQDLFDPALHDLHAESVRTARGTALPTLLLFLECWRLSPAEIFTMFLHDVRHALRLLAREPGFTAAAILTLALGVGANVAVFSVVNAALLRPLPYTGADRLYVITHRDTRTGITKEFVALGDFVDLHQRQQAFEAFAGYGGARATLYGPGEPLDVHVLQATAELAPALGLRAELGRTLAEGDTRAGAPPVMLISHEVWQSQFGGDGAVIGRSVKLGSQARQIVGVMPPGFRFPANARTDVMLPQPVPAAAPAQRKSGWAFAVARLRTGATKAQADADLHGIAQQMAAEHPDANAGSDYFAVPLREALVGDARGPLLLLLGAVALVLLIACANVANLLVARALGRRTEMAVRVALGAGRGRLLAQLGIESLVLSVVAGSVAVLCAWWAMPALARLVPPSLTLGEFAPLAVDRRVLVFAMAVTAITGLLFAVFTAMAVRPDAAVGALVNPGRVTAPPRARRAAAALVIAEMALAIVLLTGAGLFVRSFGNLLAVDPGFRPDHVLTMDIALPAERYQAGAARSEWYRRAFAALESSGSVTVAGAAEVTPLTGNNWTAPFEREDHRVPAGQRPPDVGWQAASGGYFRALQIPLLEGRLFDARDRPDGPFVVIISAALRDRFFPGEPALGRRVMVDEHQSAEIVGVVGNIRRAALTDAPRGDLYFPFEQDPPRSTTLFLRTAGDPESAVAAVRSTLRGLDPLVAIRGTRTLEAIAGASIETTRLALLLLSVFAAAALALAAVGIYGVMSYAVRQRTREIGTRMALGASPRRIQWMVMRDGLLTGATGAAIGLAGGVASARALSTLLYHVSPADPLTLAASAGLLFVVAMVASYLPARRAIRLDPVKTLASR